MKRRTSITKHECAVVMAYTGIAMLQGEDLGVFYSYVENLLDMPIWTHSLPELAEQIQEKSKADFLEICKNATE